MNATRFNKTLEIFIIYCRAWRLGGDTDKTQSIYVLNLRHAGTSLGRAASPGERVCEAAAAAGVL